MGKRWSDEEVEALLGGLEKYGSGNWKIILEDPQFGFILSSRSHTDLQNKYYRDNIKDKLAIRRNSLMATHVTHPLRPQSSRKRSKRVVVDDSDSEDYCHQYTDAPQRSGTSKNKTSHAKKSNSEKIHDDLSHWSPLSVEESSEIQLVEELSDPEDYHIPRTISRQRRGARNNIHSRKLNSDQIHTYLENLWCNIPKDKRSSFAHLDPFWYTFYSDNSKKEMVLKWIKNKNPFSRKYVVFPIVHGCVILKLAMFNVCLDVRFIHYYVRFCRGHWSVLIFCHVGESLGPYVKTPCILLLDSLEIAEHCKQVEPVIRKFVLDVYKTLEMTEDIKMLRKMPFLVPKVPQQRDDEECGYFILYYIKLFVENAPESFSTSNGYPYFMKKNWFTYEGLDNFCKTIDLSHD